MMRFVAGALLAVLTVNVAVADTNRDVYDAFAALSLPIPNRDQIVYCHGFGCRYRTPIALTSGDRARMAQIMATGKASARAERRAIARAVGWFDRHAGPRAGTARHIARAGYRHMFDPGQLDCIDASRNTMAVLLVLRELKLLRHHRIDGFEARGYVVDLNPPHVTAVLTELRNGRKWSVDAWTRAAGQPAEIMALDRWLDAE